MNGPQVTGDQALAEKAIGDLPASSEIVANRSFGIFSVAYAARNRGMGVVLRLTDIRARKLVAAISAPGEYPVVWKASRWDGGKQPRWPVEASVEGRLIAIRVGRGKSKQCSICSLHCKTPLRISLRSMAGGGRLKPTCAR